MHLQILEYKILSAFSKCFNHCHIMSALRTIPASATLGGHILVCLYRHWLMLYTLKERHHVSRLVGMSVSVDVRSMYLLPCSFAGS